MVMLLDKDNKGYVNREEFFAFFEKGLYNNGYVMGLNNNNNSNVMNNFNYYNNNYNNNKFNNHIR